MNKHLIVVCAVTLGCQTTKKTRVLVTNGQIEKGFPYVVQLVTDTDGKCTGTFLTSSILLTAAHCTDNAKTISYGDKVAERDKFYMHPGWPLEGEKCRDKEARYDLAIVKFPEGTYANEEFPRLTTKAPEAGEPILIVGFGHNMIRPFESYCRLPKYQDSDNKCHLQYGVKVAPAKFKYQKIFSFDAPPDRPDGPGCDSECSREDLEAAIKATGADLETIISTQCAGNFRDRSYEETGIGTKRSGFNQIRTVEKGTIRFVGSLGGLENGADSASGAGDSGGPLFIFRDETFFLAGVTHGGSLENMAPDESEEELWKASRYVDLYSEDSRKWFEMLKSKHGIEVMRQLEK